MLIEFNVSIHQQQRIQSTIWWSMKKLRQIVEAIGVSKCVVISIQMKPRSLFRPLLEDTDRLILHILLTVTTWNMGTLRLCWSEIIVKKCIIKGECNPETKIVKWAVRVWLLSLEMHWALSSLTIWKRADDPWKVLCIIIRSANWENKRKSSSFEE